MESNSDKKISVKTIQSIINTLMELPYKNVAMVIQSLMSLEDIETNTNRVNKKDTTESSKL